MFSFDSSVFGKVVCVGIQRKAIRCKVKQKAAAVELCLVAHERREDDPKKWRWAQTRARLQTSQGVLEADQQVFDAAASLLQ